MKTLKLLILLLALVTLFCACTNAETDNHTDASTEDTSFTPQSPEAIWYSVKESLAVQIHSATRVTYYKLKPGYYQYTGTADLICDDLTSADLQIPTADGTGISLHFDSRAGTLTNTKTSTAYTKQQTLPTQYIAYDFPDFDVLNVDSLITLTGLDTLIYPADAKAMAAREIFDEVSAGLQTLPTLTDRAAQKGDYVNVNYKGLLNGVAFEGGTAENQKILIVNQSGYIPGFAEGIIGHTVGETFSVPVTFPENYGSAALAGKSVVFEMKLNAIYSMEVSDEAIRTLTDNAHETYAAYLESVEKTHATDLLWSTVLENATYAELPDETYLYFYQYLSEPYRSYAADYGMEYETFLSMMVGVSDDYFVNYAKSYAKTFLAAYTIARQNDLTVTDAALQDELDALAEELAQQDYTAEQIAVILDDERALIQSQLLHDAVSDWLLAAARK